MSRRIRKESNRGSGAPEWMTTYSDMVTLLLAFFVLLYSFSSIDQQKWKALVESFNGNVSVLDGGTDVNPDPTIDDGVDPEDLNKDKEDNVEETHQQPPPTEHDEFYQLYRRINAYITDNSIQAEVEISDAYTEILIRFRDNILFDAGKTEIKPQAEPVLNRFAKILLEFGDQIQRIRVDGHTDNMPINTLQFPSNWELSGGRASRVVRYFQEEHHFPGNKLSMGGFGEYYPIDDNNTPEGRARNRRVDVLIIKTVDEMDIIE